MSVTAQTPYKKYTAAPGATLFSTGFRLILASDLVVKVNGVEVITGFTVSSLGAGAGSDVTFGTPMAGGEVIELLREVPKTRATDYQQLGDYQSSAVNNDFDRLVMMVQDAQFNISLAVQVQPGDAAAPLVLPSVSERSSKFLAFDAMGRPIVGTSGNASSAADLNYIPGGTGGVPTDVQTKLRETVSRSEYTSDANFNAAKVGKPNTDGSGNFDAPVTPTGEAAQIQLAKAVQPVAAGPRDAVVYNNATSVKVFRNHAVMGGFRFRGQYSKGRAPMFPMPASKIASVATGLGAESTARTESWYAVFACANAGDSTATLKVMPFLRAGTVSGSNVPLIKAGEGVHALTAQTYAWSAANNLAGVECLVITEGGKFSGRTTTITANIAGQVTLASVGTVAAYDFLLPAPPGFEHFVYLGSFYFDTAEVRNIADAGVVVKAKMIQLADPNFTVSGAVASWTELRFGGYICPLASAVVVQDTHTLSTASTGDHASYFGSDASDHEIQANYEKKTSSTSDAYVWDGVELPFAQWQSIWYKNGGSLAAQRSAAKIEIKGWLEL
jgi:hypothetical protein